MEKGIKSMHYHIHVSRYYKQEVFFRQEYIYFV